MRSTTLTPNVLRCLGGAAALALTLTLANAADTTLPAHYQCAPHVHYLSNLIGWAYFSAWSFSFYPQIITNHARCSVVGLSLDYVALNVLGYLCYSAFNLALFSSPGLRPPGADLVRVNDVFFSVHALVCCLVVAIQCCVFPRGEQRVTLLVRVALVLTTLGIAVYVVLAATRACPTGCTWIDLLFSVSCVKLAVTVAKYVPQVVLNYRRRSTVGWNIDNVVLDFTGGLLSTTQLLLDAGCTGGALISDPVKFGLGVLSMAFDSVFLYQHFCLYRQARQPKMSSLDAPAECNAAEGLLESASSR